MSADPPALMSGKGTPSTGRSPRTTAMLTSACPMIQARMPPVTVFTKGSRLCRMTLIMLIARTTKSASTTTRR